MALGELKGIALVDPVDKENFYKSIRENDFVEELFDYGNLGFCIKIKNPIFSYSYPYNSCVLPVVSGFINNNEKLDNHINESVLTITLTRKYFHDLLENIPLILSLKEKDKDFKVIFNSFEKTIDGIYPSFILDPKDSTPNVESLKYWKDFLDEFNIKFECKTIGSVNEKHTFSADYAYIFYYSDNGLGVDNKQHSHNTTGLKGNSRVYNNRLGALNFKNTYQILPLLYYTHLLAADSFEILKRNFKPFIKEVVSGKKIYINRDSKKFTDRSISNSDLLVDYLSQKGFKIINQEELNFKEQIAEITSSECIVSLVGSSFINAMFCNKETQLFIIHTDKSQDFGIYFNQSARYDIDSKVIYCDPEADDIINYFENSKNSVTHRWIHVV